MGSKRKIPWRNRTPYGWWIASYLQRFEWKGSPPKSARSRCLAWENTIVFRAGNRDLAYGKAVVLAKRSAAGQWERMGDPPGRLGRWVFEGFTSLLPIYEPLEDGAEVLWTEFRTKSIGTLRKRIKPKGRLESFED